MCLLSLAAASAAPAADADKQSATIPKAAGRLGFTSWCTSRDHGSMCPLFMRRRRIPDVPRFAAGVEIQPARLCAIQRPGAPPPEDGDLTAGLVHGPIPIKALGEAESRPSGAITRDQLGFRLGAEAVEFLPVSYTHLTLP